MDPPGIAPGSPACGAGVFLLDDEPVLSPEVHVSDLPARHAPKDLNPDQLGWNQSCCHYTRDTHCVSAEAVGLEPTSGCAATCFQDRFLIRPDDFRLQAAGVGIEPTASWFRARRHYQQQLPRIVLSQDTRRRRFASSSGAGIEPADSWFKARHPTNSDYPASCRECPAGIEPASPAWKAGTFAARPRAHVVKAEGEGVEPSRP